MNKNTLPETIKILGKPYAVNMVSLLDDGATVGEMSEHHQAITMAEGQTFENERDTLLHEIVHAVEERLLLKMRETQVARLSTGLLQVLRENSKLVRYLCEKRPTKRKLKNETDTGLEQPVPHEPTGG